MMAKASMNLDLLPDIDGLFLDWERHLFAFHIAIGKWMEPDKLRNLLATARRRCDNEERGHCAEVSAKVRLWAVSAVEGSAKAAHSYFRKADELTPSTLAEDHLDGSFIIEPLRSVESRKVDWSSRWTRDSDDIVRISRAPSDLRQLALNNYNDHIPIEDEKVEDHISRLRNS